MKYLAIETSSNACSVAVQVESQLYDRHVVEPRAHTRILLPMISALLDEADIMLTELDGIVLGNGPGSFIGMRIGASVAQGLSFGVGIEIIPLSSLAALAAEAFALSAASQVAVAQDARNNEVYLALYARGDNGHPCLLGLEKIVPVNEIVLPAQEMALAGGAWDRYGELSDLCERRSCNKLPVAVPAARYLLPMGIAAHAAGGSVPAEQLVPAYLRSKVSEVPA